jgi:hypothetical protein
MAAVPLNFTARLAATGMTPHPKGTITENRRLTPETVRTILSA